MITKSYGRENCCLSSSLKINRVFLKEGSLCSIRNISPFEGIISRFFWLVDKHRLTTLNVVGTTGKNISRDAQGTLFGKRPALRVRSA